MRIDGQQLEPEVQLTLRLLKLSGRDHFEDLPVSEARENIRREAELYSGKTIPLESVEDVEMPGGAGLAPRAPLFARRPAGPRATARLPARRRMGRRRPRDP